MLEKERIEPSMVYEVENKLSLKEFFRNEAVILVFTFLCIFFEDKDFFMILTLLPALFYPISYIVIKKSNVIERAAYFLHYGIFSVCFSFFWAVVGMAGLFSLFSGKERISSICIALIGYFISLFLWFLIIKRSIAKTNNNNLNKMAGRIPITLCGIFGMYLGRTFLKDLDQDSAKEIFCTLCFLMSYFYSVGLGIFLKYHYIMKHPEILDNKKAK